MYYRNANFGRLTLLTLFAASLTLSAQAQPMVGEARKIVALPDGDSPEGIAVDAEDGAIYVGNRSPAGAFITSDILKINDDGRVDFKFSSLPMAPATSHGLLGLATYQGDIFAALDSDVDATHGIYKVSRRGKRVQRFAGSWGIATPNALAFDDADNLYVTDSLNGAIWRFDPDNVKQPGQLWVQDELLTPDPENLFGLTEVGANGIAFAGGSLLVANTSRNTLVRVEIDNAGNPGARTVVAGGDPIGPLTTIDGVVAEDDGQTVLAVVPGFAILTSLVGEPFAPVVRIALDSGEITPVAFEDPDNPFFETPLSLALALDRRRVFVTNGALPDDDAFGVPQPGPSVVDVGIGLSAGSVAAVPEPSTAVLITFSVVSLAVMYQKRRWLDVNAQRQW